MSASSLARVRAATLLKLWRQATLLGSTVGPDIIPSHTETQTDDCARMPSTMNTAKDREISGMSALSNPNFAKQLAQPRCCFRRMTSVSNKLSVTHKFNMTHGASRSTQRTSYVRGSRD